MAASAPAQVLGDIRILDLTHYLAGPYCTKLLADLGADVLKIERPGGDPARRLGPFPADQPHPERSGLFLFLNTNKRGLVLDLKRPADRERFLALAAAADAVVESFAPGVLARLGLGYDTLAAANPRLVLSSLSNFGQTGPYRDYKSSEIVAYAMGGPMLSTGLPGRYPLKLAGTVTLFQAGNVAALATLGAILAARATGVGQQVDVSIMETAAGSADRRATYLVSYAYNGRSAPREQIVGNGYPFGPLPCADGYFNIAGGMDFFARTARMLGQPALADDPRFGGREGQTNPERKREFEEQIYLPWLLERTKAEALAAGQAAGVACAPLNTTADLLADEHFRARQFFVAIEHPVAGRLTYPGAPFKLERGGWAIGKAAPTLDEQATTWCPDSRPRTSDPLVAAPPATDPLAGIRVIDFTLIWAGPYATMLLGDLGAEVIRVESIKRWAPLTRGLMARPPRELIPRMGMIGAGYPDLDPGERPWNRAAMFNFHARNKLGMTVDLEQAEGVELFKRLVAASDVLVENNSFGVMARLGLDYATLRAANPRLIMVSASGMGATGPRARFHGFGAHFEDYCGHTWLRGYPDSDPTTTTNVVAADSAAGVSIALAVLAALHERQRSGQGQWIDMAQSENFIPYLAQAVMDYTLNGRVQGTLGNRDAEYAPQGAYPCAGDDEWVALTVTSDAEWAALVALLGPPAGLQAPELGTAAGRRAAHDRIDAAITAWTQQRSSAEAMRQLQAAGIPAGALLSEAAAHTDPQLAAREWFQTVAQAECGTHRYPGFLWRMSATPPAVRLPPVRLGEHNEYIYKQLLGVSDAEYARLEAAGHIGMDLDPSIR